MLSTALAERYRVERELGAGGMATVYLAHDVRHERRVALKVLRPELAAVIGAERFLAEIRTTANLQHPHILALFDSGQVDGTVFYVMPYVEGESLRDRLTREKQLPIDDALRITREVASALDYAHRKGVIHRDIKPENILLHDGAALVADFGIALAVSRSEGGSRMTETGMSLGTPTYMSPEQAMGERTLDARTDIYALGCVLYEMLVGEPPFTGPTAQAIVARVLTEEPRPVTGQRRSVPAHVADAVLTALEKLPADRFASAPAFAAALAQPSFTRTVAAASRSHVTAGRGTWKQVSAALAVLAIALLIALGVVLQRDGSGEIPPQPVLRFVLPLPDSIFVDNTAITPDGTRMIILTAARAFMYTFADMRLTPLDVAGLRGNNRMDTSPDGAWLAFVDGTTLKTVPLAGGPSRVLADTVQQNEVEWGEDDRIYFTRRTGGYTRFERVPSGGGAIEPLYAADDSTRALSFKVLPGGKALVSALDRTNLRVVQMSVIDLRTKARRLIEPGPHSDMFAFGVSPTGHLLYTAPDGVYAARFDLNRHEFVGAPVPIVSSLPLSVDFNAGMLVYNLVPPQGPTLVDRRGVRRELPGAVTPGTWSFSTSVSPSGHAFALFRYQSPADRWDVWTYRLPAGPLTRISADTFRVNARPFWSHDGRTIHFLASGGNERRSLYSAPADGSGGVALTLSRAGDIGQAAPVRTGRFVIVEEGQGLSVVTPGVDSAVRLVDARFQPQLPAVSPDGRWVAYSSTEAGGREIFVRALDGSGGRTQVSRNSGSHPAWGRSGRELFFTAADSMYAAGVTPGASFGIASIRALFRLGRILPDGFDVLPGDSLFVMLAPSATESGKVVVVANFLEELRALSREATGR